MANKKEVPTGKVPPQNLDAEMSLLGAVLIDDEVIADASELVKDKDFYDKNKVNGIFLNYISLFQ